MTAIHARRITATVPRRLVQRIARGSGVDALLRLLGLLGRSGPVAFTGVELNTLGHRDLALRLSAATERESVSESLPALAPAGDEQRR